MFDDWNVSHIVAALVAVFFLGLAIDEYHSYTEKRAFCQKVETLAVGLNRELSQDHKCRAYLRSQN